MDKTILGISIRLLHKLVFLLYHRAEKTGRIFAIMELNYILLEISK